MKAVVYKAPFQVAVEEVPEPHIETPNDAIIKVTTTNICGSDLHMYEGRTGVEEGKILDATDGLGVDCGIEAVGYQAHDPDGTEHPEMVMDWLVACVRATGGLGVVGVYLPQDPGATDERAKDGRIGW